MDMAEASYDQTHIIEQAPEQSPILPKACPSKSEDPEEVSIEPKHSKQCTAPIDAKVLDGISTHYVFVLVGVSFLYSLVVLLVYTTLLERGELSWSLWLIEMGLLSGMVLLLVGILLYAHFAKDSASRGHLTTFGVALIACQVTTGLISCYASSEHTNRRNISDGQFLTIFSIGTIFLFRQILHNSTAHIAVLSGSLLAFLALEDYLLDKFLTAASFYRLGLTGLFLFYLLKNTWRIQQAMRLMIEQKKNDEHVLDRKSFRTLLAPFAAGNSELELLIDRCHKIEQNLRRARNTINSAENKRIYSVSLEDIRFIAIRIAHGFSGSEFLQAQDLDKDDAQFLSEYCSLTYSSLPSQKYQIRMRSRECDQGFFYEIEEVESVLRTVGKVWNFDIYLVKKTTGQSISILARFLLQKWALLDEFCILPATSENFFGALEAAYPNNPYHNDCHAADVLHSFLYFLRHGKLLASVQSLELLSCLIAALAHDVGHPGLTNRFLVNTRHDLATKYNDCSVLENMHAAMAFQLMQDPDKDLFRNCSDEHWVNARKFILELVLATDMGRHFELLARFKSRAMILNDLVCQREEDRILILAMGLKCADIGHTAKETDLHLKWTERITEEFYQQGDIEKALGQPVSMYCDREVSNLAKSQVAFISNICLPLYEVWCNFLGAEEIDKCLARMLKNIRMWENKNLKKLKTESNVERSEHKLYKVSSVVS